MTNLTTPAAALPSLQRRLEGRALRSLVLTILAWLAALLASVPPLNTLTCSVYTLPLRKTSP